MSWVTFLTTVSDAVTPNTVYGKGHQVNIADEVVARNLRSEGKVALVAAEPRNVRASAIGTTTATLAFTIDYPPTEAGRVDYGTSTAFGSSSGFVPATGVGDFTASLTSLTTGTTYYYRVVTYFGGNHNFSAIYSFRTL